MYICRGPTLTGSGFGEPSVPVDEEGPAVDVGGLDGGPSRTQS